MESDSTPRTDTEIGFQEALRKLQSGDSTGAIEGYRAVLEVDPGHLRARNNLAVLLDRTGYHEEAVAHLQAALELHPENPELLSNLGAALGALGRFDEAEDALRRALRLEPNGTHIRANLGILHFRRGLTEQAESELRWVCERDGDHASAHFYRGEALNQLGRVDEGLRVLERAVELQPTNARAYHLMGILYDRKGEPERASEMYRKARTLSSR